jgi:hypothetical protein
MTAFSRQIRPLVLFTGIVLLLVTPVFADTLYTAVLDGSTAGTPSSASGFASLTLNTAQTEVSYVVNYSGLLGGELASHIHNAAPGELGPRFHTFFPGNPKVGIWPVGPFEVAELNAGRVYINIHTDLYPTGELRGNVSYTTVANDAVSWGRIKSLFR